MEKSDIIQKMVKALLDLDQEEGTAAANLAVENQLDLVEFIEEGMATAMECIGELFQQGEVFLPTLMIAGNIFQSAMAIIQPELLKSQAGTATKGRVIIGTVKGDLHSIGKDLVAIMLKSGGFEVFDLGVDIPVLKFLEEADKNNANVIALSSLLTTTLPVVREVIDAVKDRGLGTRFKILVGGAAVNEEYATEIGADAYGQDAADAVKLTRELCADTKSVTTPFQ